MSWERIEGRTLKADDSVRMSLLPVSNHRYSPALSLSIGRRVAGELGMNANMRVDVFFGTGNHAGYMRVVPSATGKYRLRGRGRVGSLMVTVYKTPARTVCKSHGSEIVTHVMERESGALQVKFPEWLFKSALKVAA